MERITILPEDKEFNVFANTLGGNGFLFNEHFLSAHYLKQGGNIVGRFALYENSLLRFKGDRALCIGYYACIDEDSVAETLLSWAEDMCIKKGYNQLIGPMDGSTWYDYRLSRGPEGGVFMMDINNPDYFNQQFVSSGFQKIATYYTSVDELMDKYHLSDALKARIASKGLTIRCLDKANISDELGKIADFCNVAFAKNFLFTPIDRQKFVDKYLPLERLLDPKLILMAEDKDGVICSLIFMLRDVSDPAGTVIMKTVAGLPGHKYIGLTSYLAHMCANKLRVQGVDRIIYAFMHADNSSFATASKVGSAIKEYAIYAKHVSK